MTKVLFFGSTVTNNIEIDSTDELEFKFIHYPREQLTDLTDLPSYPIIIMDYDVFYLNGEANLKDMHLVAKHLIRAAEKGSYIVFLHYAERVPEYSEYNWKLYEMERDSYLEFYRNQLSFQLLMTADAKVRPGRYTSPLHEYSVPSHYFADYLDKWGSSHMVFNNYDDELIIPIQKNSSNKLMSFAKPFKKGQLLYLASHFNRADNEDVRKLLLSLAAAVQSYRAHSFLQVPEWAQQPFFKEEAELFTKKEKLLKEVADIEKQTLPYSQAKQLAFKSDNEFSGYLCQFLTDNFFDEVKNVERFLEDFTILEEGEVVTAGEAKAVNGGATRSQVYQLHNHRESQGWDEKMHGLLVVNQNLIAESWKDRDRNFDPTVYTTATRENILVLRLIDLLRLWEMVRQKVLTKEEAKEILLTKKGWLKIDSKFTIEYKN